MVTTKITFVSVQRTITTMTDQSGTSNNNPIVLYDENAFPQRGTNLTDDQLRNHWSLDKGATGSYTDEARTVTQKTLIGCRNVVKDLATIKLRSAMSEQLRLRKVLQSDIPSVVKLFHSSNVTLKLCEDIFYAFFTWPEENKEALFERLAGEIISDMGITFHKTTTDRTCIVGVVKEALHTVRKQVMVSGKPAKSKMFMSTRNVTEGFGVVPNVPPHVFTYHKLGGWDYLNTVDYEAKRTFDKMYSPKCEAASTGVINKASAHPGQQYASGGLVPITGASWPEPGSSAEVTIAQSQNSESQSSNQTPAVSKGNYDNLFAHPTFFEDTTEPSLDESFRPNVVENTQGKQIALNGSSSSTVGATYQSISQLPPLQAQGRSSALAVGAAYQSINQLPPIQADIFGPDFARTRSSSIENDVGVLQIPTNRDHMLTISDMSGNSEVTTEVLLHGVRKHFYIWRFNSLRFCVLWISDNSSNVGGNIGKQ